MFPNFPAAYTSLAERMVDAPLPATPGLWSYSTGIGFDPIWLLLFSSGVFFYLAGIWRLHRGGGRWPLRRTAFWLAGLATLLYTTSGGINAYREFLLSTHVLMQMLLITVVPMLLAAGRPAALVLQPIETRTDGRWRPQGWIRAVTASLMLRALLNPFAAMVLLNASLLIFYNSPLLEWAVQDPLGHQWMTVSFLAVGALFVNSLRRSAPGPDHRPPDSVYAVLMATLSYIAMGLFMLSSPNLLLADWYGALGSPWAIDPVNDQRLAGAYVLVLGIVQGGLLSFALLKRPFDDGPGTCTSVTEVTVAASRPL